MAVIDRKAGRAALHELHRARQRRYLVDVDWIDSLYKAYITGIIAVAAVFFGSRLFGTDQVTPSELADVRRYGPAALGLLVAIAVAAGLRSGSRGGPLALEPPDVTHLLLAPVPRATVLRRATFSQLRGVVFVGAVFGAVAGNLAAFRLPGERIEWVISGTAFGALTVLAAWGAALLMSGNRVGTRVATAVGLVLIAWSAADLATHGHSSPGSQLARVALLPLTSDVAAVAGAVGAVGVVILVTVAGLRGIGGSSIEAAERRARLVGELRFAATLQDVRTVIVLHRQLALQLPRSRPWFRVDGEHRRTRPAGVLSCWARDWQGIARWPGNRLVRQLALGLIAGAALAAVWHGTPALILVAGIALFLAGLDATEGLAQETDHPLLPSGYPVQWGKLLIRHLVAPTCLVLLGELAGLVVVAAFSGSTTADRGRRDGARTGRARGDRRRRGGGGAGHAVGQPPGVRLRDGVPRGRDPADHPPPDLPAGPRRARGGSGRGGRRHHAGQPGRDRRRHGRGAAARGHRGRDLDPHPEARVRMSDTDTNTNADTGTTRRPHPRRCSRDDVRKEYGDVVALHDLRIEVARGELVALVGPNGAGKSTFLRCAAGLLEPSDGVLLVEGRPAGSIERARRAVLHRATSPCSTTT